MMLTVKQVAEELSISATCVYQLVAAGKIASHRIGIGRGTVRISDDDLAAYVDSCRLENRASGIAAPKKPTVKRNHFKHLNFDHNSEQGSDNV